MIRYLSLYDIMFFPDAAEIVRSGTEEEFVELLYNLGFDKNKPIEQQECYHRPLTKKSTEPIFGMRIVGSERTDEAWRKSGLWSMDARMEEYRNNDFELYKEMFQMSYSHNYTGALIEHMQNKGSLLPYYFEISGEELENNDE